MLYVYLGYEAWQNCWYLGLHIFKSSWSTYRFISGISSPIIISSDAENSIDWACVSKQLGTGFTFTNTDSEDVTRGYSLTVIASLLVGFRNPSNGGDICWYKTLLFGYHGQIWFDHAWNDVQGVVLEYFTNWFLALYWLYRVVWSLPVCLGLVDIFRRVAADCRDTW